MPEKRLSLTQLYFLPHPAQTGAQILYSPKSGEKKEQGDSITFSFSGILVIVPNLRYTQLFKIPP